MSVPARRHQAFNLYQVADGETVIFADTPSPSLLKHLPDGEGGCSRMTASPTAIDQSALDEGVRRVVVASSNHAADFYEPHILDGEVWPLVVVVLLLVLLVLLVLFDCVLKHIVALYQSWCTLHSADLPVHFQLNCSTTRSTRMAVRLPTTSTAGPRSPMRTSGLCTLPGSSTARCGAHGPRIGHCARGIVHAALCTRHYAHCIVHMALCTRHCAHGIMHTALCTRHCAHGIGQHREHTPAPSSPLAAPTPVQHCTHSIVNRAGLPSLAFSLSIHCLSLRFHCLPLRFVHSCRHS